jgi:PAS domain S-box-containing protein
MIWIAGADRLCTFFNAGWLEFRGRTMDQEIGSGWVGGIHPDDMERCLEVWDASFHRKSEFALEYRLLRHDGVYRWVVDRGIPRYTVTGDFLGYIGTCVDITDRKLLEDELERRVVQRTEELEAANREMESLSSTVSNDLRSPLRAIQGYSHMLLEDHGRQLPADGVWLLEKIRTGALQMNRRLDDVLFFSQLANQPLERRSVLVAETVRQCIAELAPEVQGRDVAFAVGELPPCVADPVLLKRVFANLLANAVKFTRPRPQARIEVGCEWHRSRPTFFVRDNGVGFDRRFTDQLFGAFRRLHAAAEFEGTGVGLAIAQRIVERHGGRIWAESDLDEGATFYFRLEPARNVAHAR